MKQQMQTRIPAAAPLGSVAVLYWLNITASSTAVATCRHGGWNGIGGKGGVLHRQHAAAEQQGNVIQDIQDAARQRTTACRSSWPCRATHASQVGQPRATKDHPPWSHS